MRGLPQVNRQQTFESAFPVFPNRKRALAYGLSIVCANRKALVGKTLNLRPDTRRSCSR
jgi:hypothetical protein